MSDEKYAELAGLLQTQLDGTIDKVTKQRLAELLRGDPAAQAYYVEFCQMHAMLAWEHGVLTEIEADDFTHSELYTATKSKSQLTHRS